MDPAGYQQYRWKSRLWDIHLAAIRNYTGFRPGKREDFQTLIRKLPSKLKNAESLPCPKQELELAIKVQLLTHIANEAEADIDKLKRRYIDIASFQHIHTEDKDVLDEALDCTNNEPDMADANLHPIYQKYINLAQSEQNSLIDKINRYIQDIKNLQ
jgi:hypothetical protein